jgi:TRAP-type C4-dicarboxylate transport system substrate-binding protein
MGGTLRAGLLAALVTVCLAAPARAEDGAVNWKIGTLAPKRVGWAKHIEGVLHPALDKATEGKLDLKWYWGGIMGDDEDYIKKMRVGQLQGMGASAQGLALGCPEMGIVMLPFMFRSLEEVWHIKREMRVNFEEIARKNGFALLYWIDQDFDQIYSAKFPMSAPGDFSKAKIITWYGTVEEKMLGALGAVPVPVNVPEVSPSMRQGLADTVIAPALWMIGAQMYSVVRYVNPVKIRYSPGGLLVLKEAWDGLPEQWRAGIMAGRPDVEERFSKQVAAENTRSVEAMVQYGVRKVEMSPAEVAEIQKRTAPVWDALAGEVYPKALLDELKAKLGAYRKNAKS